MVRVFFIMPLRVDASFEAKRQAAIDIVGDGAILPDVDTSNAQAGFEIVETIESLKTVELVIADLSFERPSCYFELGMAQAMGIRSFLIAEQGTPLHQHSGNVQFYRGLDEFRCLINSAIHGADAIEQNNQTLNPSGNGGRASG